VPEEQQLSPPEAHQQPQQQQQQQQLGSRAAPDSSGPGGRAPGAVQITLAAPAARTAAATSARGTASLYSSPLHHTAMSIKVRQCRNRRQVTLLGGQVTGRQLPALHCPLRMLGPASW
jgi:hypothetical protein